MEINSIIEHPYLIYHGATGDKWTTSTSDRNGRKDITKFLNAKLGSQKEVAEGRLIDIITFLYLTELAKEQKMVEAITGPGSAIPDTVKNTLNNLLKTKSYSAFMTYFDAFQKDLIDDKATYEEALDEVKKFYQTFTYKRDNALIHAFFEQYKWEIGKTVEQVFKDLTDFVRNYDKNFTSKQIQILQNTIGKLKNDYKRTKQKPDLEHIFAAEDFQQTTKTKRDGSEETIRSVVEELTSKIIGTFRGKTLEMATAENVVGTITIQGKNIDTDTIATYTATFERGTKTIEDINKKIGLTTEYEDLKKIERQLTENGGYSVHYSVKGGNMSLLKIKENATYEQRLQEIKEMFSKLQINQNNYKEFIFTFANTINGFIADNKWNDVKATLQQFAAIWMFDDIIPDLRKELETQPTNLNFYNIQGYTITGSDLFLMLKERLQGQRSKEFIIFTKDTDKKYEEKHPKKAEQSDWDYIYQSGMNTQRLGLKMYGKNLFDALLKA